ncbi:MAG: hypothetical protein K2F68_09820 [Duncaniella sp.]|nr:hypothetical protein [Duncaniella sp.]
MKHILPFIIALASLALTATSCGGDSTKEQTVVSADVEEQNTQLAEALSAGNLKAASAMADSMSLFVDDFTPEQTVQVLMAFLTVHNDAVSKKERRRDLETLRKYVDVYDIALSVNPKDTRAAFEKAMRINPTVNFDSIAQSFREKLTQYDAIHDGSLVTDEPQQTDTVAADTMPASRQNSDNPADLPLELRPAE